MNTSSSPFTLSHNMLTKYQYKLTIVTSTLNDSKGMNKTLESLLSMNHDLVEWVVIDGGSIDNTVSMMSSYACVSTYPRCTLYGGFNRGIEHSRGEYVVFLNSGDTILSQAVLDALVMQLNDKDVYYFDTQLSNGDLFPIKALENIPFNMPFSHQGCAMKIETVKKMDCFSEYSGPAADHELILKMWLNECSFEKLNLCLIKCAPFTSTEDDIGKLLNRWRNVRNIYKKSYPDEKTKIDKKYGQLLSFML